MHELEGAAADHHDQHADEAHPADGAQHADEAQHADGAQHADDAQHADGAQHADEAQQADGAQHADDAQHADEAQHADGAQHADDDRPRLAFIGAGRVGTALAIAFSRAGWRVAAAASRDETRRDRFARLVPGARAYAAANAVLDDADLIFLTVPDDAVAEVASSVHLYSGQALVHTSGALAASVLEPARAAGTSLGGFHPLVTFADVERALADLAGATIALEGDDGLLPVLAELAESIGGRPVRLPAGAKTAYHAAAMLAAGGLVAVLDTIAQLAAGAGLDEASALRVYLPLARQAMANAERLGVEAALTGPLVRGDAGTLRAHLDWLHAHAPSALPLYLELARRELEIAQRRGELPAERAAELRELLGAAEPRSRSSTASRST